MICQENAYYENQIWCVYELKDGYGRYDEELRLKMRMESQEKKLICPECGEPLILCAGQIMEPYFKHYDQSQCPVRNHGSRSGYTQARRLLYQLARQSFPGIPIGCSQKVGPYIADVCVDQFMVFEYLTSDMKLSAWREKHQYYEEHGIRDIWFLSSRRYRKKGNTTFEYLVSKESGQYLILDGTKQMVTIKELYRQYGTRITHSIEKSYPLGELRMDRNGGFLCDFAAYKADWLADFHKKEEARIRRERVKVVERRTEGDGERTELTMEMTAISEWWEIPVLRGAEEQVHRAAERRQQYLQGMNTRLKYAESLDEKLDLIDECIWTINHKILADMW